MNDVIFVDDELDALKTILETIVSHNDQLNYHLFDANPEKVLSFSRENHIDIAFLDIRMPSMDGIELAHKLIQIQPLIKIVFISGYVQDEEKLKKEFKNNFLTFLYKPFDEEGLKKCLSLVEGVHTIEIYTEGAGNLVVDGEMVDFVYQKSKEFFFYLVAHANRMVKMSQTMEALWTDKQVSLAKRVYRDAVYKLRRTLAQRGIESIISFKRGRAIFYSKGTYIDFLANKKDPKELEKRFLPEYPWSLDALQSMNLTQTETEESGE